MPRVVKIIFELTTEDGTAHTAIFLTADKVDALMVDEESLGSFLQGLMFEPLTHIMGPEASS